MTQSIATLPVGIHDWNDNVVEVTLLQLLQWRGALRLEARGMKHSRGSVTAHVRRVLSAPRNYPREDLIAHLDASIQDLNEQLGV